jgi:hypothetical protein
MASSQKRSKQIKLTITPEIHARLVALGERLGQAPATLASMAISIFVADQENRLGATNRAIDAMAAHLGPEFAQQMKLAMETPGDD